MAACCCCDQRQEGQAHHKDSPTPISDDASFTRPTNSPRRATHTPPTVQHRGSMGQSWRRPESEPRLGKLECWVERARNLNPQNIDVRREGREGGGQERRTAELRGGCSWSRSLRRALWCLCVRFCACSHRRDRPSSLPSPSSLLPSLPGQVVEGWPNCSVFIVFSMQLSSGFRRKESSRNIVRGSRRRERQGGREGGCIHLPTGNCMWAPSSLSFHSSSHFKTGCTGRVGAAGAHLARKGGGMERRAVPTEVGRGGREGERGRERERMIIVCYAPRMFHVSPCGTKTWESSLPLQNRLCICFLLSFI